MPKYDFECLYCGNKWEQIMYLSPDVVDLACSKCMDENVKARLIAPDTRDPFGYNYVKELKPSKRPR